MIKQILTTAVFIGFGILASCSEGTPPPQEQVNSEAEFYVNFEKYTLDNGLEVVFHIDRSDPVVAVALTSHVGSAREKPGRTGFAHMFEHLFFLESENLGKGGLDQMSSRIGGSGANGSTSRDRTNYFQTVPNDALEKMIWAEADKLGFFINTVTNAVVEKEKQVVKNEKRQSVDNRPYGHTRYVIDKALYPEDHPYNWQVIGSLEDLQNAKLEDVKNFYFDWYVPNNVTLTIAGDFETDQAKIWVEKYFGEIKRGKDILPLEKRPSPLSEVKSFYHEDNFARVPELTMVWPGVPQYHPDSYALSVLKSLLSGTKNSAFNKLLVDDLKLTDGVGMGSYNSELAGQEIISIRAFEGVDLDDIKKAVDQAFLKFEQEGFKDEDLDRIKASQETGFYNSLSSVLGKGFQLAQYNIFTGDPGFINQDIKNILDVNRADIMRVYETYIKGKPYVATSFVPMGQVGLALEGSQIAHVVEEQIVIGGDAEVDASAQAEYERTPSSFDRTIEPPYGLEPQIKIPKVWESSLSNGMKIYGIEDGEIPLVRFNITLKGGLLLDDIKKVGVANLLSDLMMKGTKSKTTAELEEAIDKLGAGIGVGAGSESFVISGTTLKRNYEKTLALIEEILLEPRWDEEEFELAKLSTLNSLNQQLANPQAIAGNNFSTLLYGEDNIFSKNIMGTVASVNAITLDDLKAYYKAYLSPKVANFHVVGDISQEEVITSLEGLNTGWRGEDITYPDYPMPSDLEESKIYFYDVPGAKQSAIRFGYLALSANDPDYYKASVMNYKLGGGSFASQLTQVLREGKGYTYGIGSGFGGSQTKGPFRIGSNIRSNVTFEAFEIIKDIMESYGESLTREDLDNTKNFMLKSQARSFETMGAKLGMLSNISTLGWPYDYTNSRQQIVRDMTLEDMKALADKYIRPNRMIYLIVGDAETQLDRLKAIGFGDPILLNP